MLRLRTLIDYALANKDKVALAFSVVALVVSSSKTVVDFIVPVDLLDKARILRAVDLQVHHVRSPFPILPGESDPAWYL